MPAPAPIDLRGDRGEYGLTFNLSTRVEPANASLHLEMTNSVALLAPRSQVLVKLNDVVVAQLALKPNAPITEADIDLPVELLRGGGNRLSFAVAQHYTNECENPTAAELWTEINTEKSRLTIGGVPSAASLLLSDLAGLLSPAMFGGRHFTLLSPAAPGRLNEAQLATGATISEALALRLRWKPAEINLAEATATDNPEAALHFAAPAERQADEPADLVLFGTKDTLRPFLSRQITDSINRGFIGLYPFPGDRQRLVLVVSGTSDEDVAEAAGALAVANFPFVDAPSQSIGGLERQPGNLFFPQNNLTAGASVQFAELGLPTTTLRGESSATQLDVVIPADFYTPDNADVELKLDFAYGAGLRRDSVVNIVLNGQFQQAIALDDPAGAVLRGYQLKLPVRKFEPGHNTIRFEVGMTPSASGACTPIQTRNLIFVLHDTSSVLLPNGDHMAAQPDLHLFSASGFPYVTGEPFDMSLASSDPATVAAGWTVLARLAQVAGRALPEARLTFGMPAADRHVFLVGAAPDLDDSLLGTSPVGVRTGSLPYASNAPRPLSRTWIDALPNPLAPAARAAEPNNADVTRTSGTGALGRNGLLMAAISPLAPNRTITILTAGTREQVRTAAQQMVQPAVWYQLGQDVTLWRDGTDIVSTQRVGPTYHLGSRSSLAALRYLAGQYPLAWIGSLTGLVLLLATLLRLQMVRRRRRLYPRSTEGVL